MTPTAATADVSTPPPSSGGGNLEDRFSDAFSSALSSGPEPSQAAPAEVTPPASDPTPEVTEPETSEDGADATAAEPNLVATEEDPYADLDDPGDQPALEKFLTTPRGREIYQGYKFVQELAKPTAQGGIGHVPTIQDVKQYFGDHQSILAMRNDFSSGDPRAIGKFFGHWFGPDSNGRPRATAMAALEHLEPALAQFGTEIYGQIAHPVMARTEVAMIDKWKSAPPELKDTYYYAAQAIHRELTGEYLPKDLGTSGRAENGQFAANPARAQIDAEWQRLNAARNANRQEIEGQWNAKLDESESAALSSEIDKALKPMAEVRAKTPETYEALKERMAKQVKDAMTADPQLWNLYQAKVAAARKTGNPAAAESVMKDYLALAIPIIREKRNPFLKGAGVVIKQQNADRHAQLRSVASNVAPSNNGAPPQKSVVPISKPNPGESRDDYRERRMREALR